MKPEECVFVDDTEENVVAAGQLDFNGIVFKTYEDMIKSLKEFKIEIREEDY